MKNMKKVLALALAGVMTLGMCACGSSSSSSSSDASSDDAASTEGTAVKIGLITLHDENSTYDNNFITAFKEACEEEGLTEDDYVIKSNVAEDSTCYDTAVDLADSGCNIVFADSFSHEDYMIQAAKEYPDVQFCHATGTQAHTVGLDNFHDAFASIYEGRYLAGVAAGMKIQEMIDNGEITEDQAVMGYVGAYPYAEVKSGYTSFYLGAKSVVPSVTMKVTFTNSWYDQTAEQEAANKLIEEGCILISQHADSMGAPNACETAGVPDVAYNGETGKDTFVVASRVNWTPYFKYIIECVKNGEAIDTDWVGTIDSGSVVLTDLGPAAAEGTQEKLDEVQAQLQDGTLHVFDTSTFTVDGEEVTSYMADVDSDPDYTPDTEVIKDGYFDESDPELRSAPYFDLDIDGIEDISGDAQ